jgi:hypothetical protein
MAPTRPASSVVSTIPPSRPSSASWNRSTRAAVAEAEEQFKQLKIDSRKKLGKVSVNPLYETLYDKETEEPTGEVKFTFKRRASGTFKKGPKTGQKWSHKLAVFDSKGG